MDPIITLTILRILRKRSLWFAIVILAGGYFFYVKKTGRNVGQDVEKVKEIKQKIEEKSANKKLDF